MSRGRDWTVLGGEDPTPGEVGVLDHVRAGFTTAQGDSLVVAVDVIGVRNRLGGAGWEGAAADAFGSALGPLPTLMAELSGAYADAVAALEGWAEDLTALQRQADDLLAEAQDNHDRLEVARDALPGAIAERQAAAAALAAAQQAAAAADPPGSGDGAVQSAFLRYDRADGDVVRLQLEVADREEAHRGHLRDAEQLAEQHEARAGSAAAAIADAEPPAIPMAPFAGNVAIARISAALPDVDADADGDGIVSAAEVAALISEVLQQRPSEEHVEALDQLGVLLRALGQDPGVSEDVVTELGPEGLQQLYETLYHVGATYPFDPEAGMLVPYDPDRILRPDLAGLLDGLNDVVAAGSLGTAGREVVEDLIDLARDPWSPWEAATLAGLARADGLSQSLGEQVVDAIRDLEPYQVLSGSVGYHVPQSLFPELVENPAALLALAVGSTPEVLIGPDGSLDTALLAEVLDTSARSEELKALVGGALGEAVQHVLDVTDPGDLVGRDADGRPTGDGVLFDLAELLLEADVEGLGDGILTALAPHLPVLTGALPGSPAGLTSDQLGALVADLLEDLSPAQVDQALEAITAGAVAAVRDAVVPGDFDLGDDPQDVLGRLLDGVLGPVQVAMGDIAEDRQEAADRVNEALKTALGLIPIPGGEIASTAITTGVEALIDRATDVEGVDADLVREMRANAISAAVAGIYADEALRESITATSLQDWAANRERLEARGITDGRIAEIEAALRAGEVPADVFVDLPEVVRLIDDLDDVLVLSPASQR